MYRTRPLWPCQPTLILCSRPRCYLPWSCCQVCCHRQAGCHLSTQWLRCCHTRWRPVPPTLTFVLPSMVATLPMGPWFGPRPFWDGCFWEQTGNNTFKWRAASTQHSPLLCSHAGDSFSLLVRSTACVAHRLGVPKKVSTLENKHIQQLKRKKSRYVLVF